MHQTIDEIIEGLIIGEKWALEHYGVGNEYQTGREIRKAIAQHIPEKIIADRIKDLEKEIENLKRKVSYYKNKDY